MSDRLDPAAIERALADLPGWIHDGQALAKTFDRADFDGSITFVNAIARAATALNHHPDLAVAWNNVTVRTWSHDSGGITPRDVRLAGDIERLSA